jgi:hypothetical protein
MTKRKAIILVLILLIKTEVFSQDLYNIKIDSIIYNNITVFKYGKIVDQNLKIINCDSNGNYSEISTSYFLITYNDKCKFIYNTDYDSMNRSKFIITVKCKKNKKNYYFVSISNYYVWQTYYRIKEDYKKYIVSQIDFY